MVRTSAVLGIIAPHPPIMVEAVGGPRAAVTAASAHAMERAAEALAAFAPDTLVIMSPHAPAVSDAFAVDTSPRVAGTLAAFGAPGASFSYHTDLELAEGILSAYAGADLPTIPRSADPRLAPGELDHGVLVPLSFLDPRGEHPVVVLSLSGRSLADHRRAGTAVAEAATALRRRIAFIASGDLSHRLTPDAPAGHARRAPLFDAEVVRLVGEGDLDALAAIDPALIAEAGECGLRSFIALAGAVPEPSAEVLAYEGPWGVGYLTAIVRPDAAPGSRATPAAGRKGGAAGGDSHPIVAYARAVIEAHVLGEAPPPPPPAADLADLPARAGAFVTLSRGGALRGCIGTIAPTTDSLAEEVARNAVKAATEDPRFPPLGPAELADLELKVDVLHEPESTTAHELDPARFGVIVSCGWRRGLLLPDLEGIDSAAQQLEIARRKAGIGPDESVRLERFRVDRHC